MDQESHLEGEWQSLPAMMLRLAATWPNRVLARHWQGGAWRETLWGDFAIQVAQAAAGLRHLGVMPGDRVMLVSENRPEFMIADNAIMAIGAITVPTYTTNTLADHAHVLRDCGARVAITSQRALAERVMQAAAEVAGLDALICMDATPPGAAGTRAVLWSQLLVAEADPAMLLAEVEHIPAGRLACLIYTSGTGGAPKGVMLPHRAMLSNAAGATPLLSRLQLQGERYLSFLPMSHSYEHTVGGFLLPKMGMEVVFSRGADRISAEMTQFQPAIITAVPRLFEVLRARIEAQLEKDGGLKQALFRRALALGLRRLDGPALGPLERIQHMVLDRLVGKKIRARFGGRIKGMISGGARLDPDLSGFFLALGLPVIQGYGQSEAGPVVSVNLPWFNDRHTVGPPLPGVTARIAEDGELLIKGGLVMDGYWNNAEASASAIQHGWLHTGDVGRIDDAGRISITDRKRDFIKLMGGDMVAPAKLEALLMAEAEIAQAVVAGEGQPGILALIVPADGMADKLEAAVKRVNAKLSAIERIRRWRALEEPFTIENGLLTASMKVRRRAVLERHAQALLALQK
ncbi:MAG: long-chain fatty acid--CoA ligase [Alphaproteobacteria bacterium]|nr:long-chain fatty acid--CoA ligase [Alphaproteobacteria bacterium]